MKVAPIIAAFAAFLVFSSNSSLAASCNYDGRLFSENAPISIGDAVFACNNDSEWSLMESEKDQFANCFYASKIYTRGALIQVGPDTLQCTKDGSWAKPS